jgi:hypothetical protein
VARVLLLALVGAVVAALVGINFGWEWVGGPILGYVVYRFVIGNLRALVHAGRSGADDEDAEPTPVSGDERTLFWCEECGTEVLLLVRGTSRAPSHCGQRMHERTELLHN